MADDQVPTSPVRPSFSALAREQFSHFAHAAADQSGSAWAFIGAVLMIVIWVALGPSYNYSDTWQLVINTGTTIITFLMVFLIQNTQNRDSKAIHLKLDELIRAQENARNWFIHLEKGSDQQLEVASTQLKDLATTLKDTTHD